MVSKSLFSSKSDEWSTPLDLFEKLDSEFHFDLDPCSTAENHLCHRFFTKTDDGLSQMWTGSVFVNPPYSDVKSWVRKCYVESFTCKCIVLLVPARTDTSWFHDYVLNKADIRFIRGRLKFGNSKNSAPFPSMIVIWK